MAERPNREQRRDRSSHGTQVQLRYIKSTVGPVLHADGIFGGLTPQGAIYLAFFAEHAKIPDSVTLEVDATGPTREVGSRPTEWVREVGVEITMSLNVAQSLRAWLDEKFNAYERATAGQASATASQAEGERES